MIPMMLQQGYMALAITFDVWGLANMVNNGVKEARAVVLKDAEEAAAKENGTADGSADGAAEVVVGKAPPS